MKVSIIQTHKADNTLQPGLQDTDQHGKQTRLQTLYKEKSQ